MSRFDRYRTPQSELAKLEVGQVLVAKLLGDHEYTPKATKEKPQPDPIPVLELLTREGNEIALMAGPWSLREVLALADPGVGDVIEVRRLEDRGFSHSYDMKVVQRAAPPEPEVPFDAPEPPPAAESFGDDEIPF